MYFVVIMAFALVLSDNLPVEGWGFCLEAPSTGSLPLLVTLAAVVGQVLLVAITAMFARRMTLARLADPASGYDHAANTYSVWQTILLVITGSALVGTMVLTPWAPLVRQGWQLDRIPLVGDLLLLVPFFASLALMWIILFPVEGRIRHAAVAHVDVAGPSEQRTTADDDARPCTDATGSSDRRSSPPNGQRDSACTAPTATASVRDENGGGAELSVPAFILEQPTDTGQEPLPAGLPRERNEGGRGPAWTSPTHPVRVGPPPTASLGLYLLDKFRHQVFIIAAPMTLIVLAKHFTDMFRRDLTQATTLPWAADSLLGLISVCVLGVAPVLLRYVWSTKPMAPGPLRERFVATCRRIGLRYNELLVWHTHGTAVNAAVMGFVAPLRYILVSDALLETMNEDEIQAIFGHEAGHVRKHHLQFFVLFALVSMYLAGGAVILLVELDLAGVDASQLAGLAVLLGAWLFGFGWLSRRFERHADVYGVRCVTPHVASCVDSCPVHGGQPRFGLCTSAANLFGRTLAKIADLNGIPRDAPSWRHGSIEDRCRLIERLAAEPARLKRFDRKILWIKAGLLIAAILGTIGAALLFGEQILHAVAVWFKR